MQLESGVSVTRDHLAIDGVGRVEFTTLELPNALLRAGLTRRLELRAAMIGSIRSTTDRAFADPASVLSTSTSPPSISSRRRRASALISR